MAIPFVLTAAHVGRRQKLNVAGTESVNVRVGDPAVAWVPGSFIEVVRNSAGAEVAFTPFNGTVTINYLGASLNVLNELNVAPGLRDGEYARLVCVDSDIWDLHIQRLPSDVFNLKYNWSPDELTTATPIAGLFSAQAGVQTAFNQFTDFYLASTDLNGVSVNATVNEARSKGLALECNLQNFNRNTYARLSVSDPDPMVVLAPPYRGFQYGYSMVYGSGDKTILKLIITGDGSTNTFTATNDTDNDDLQVSMSAATPMVAMVAIHPDNDVAVSTGDIDSFFRAFVDNVLWDGASLHTDVGLLQSSFYNNIAALVGVLPPLDPNFEFYDDYPTNTVWPANSIDDGGYDQYDGGNYVNTNLATEVSYNGGLPVSSPAADALFGPGSSYAALYQNAIFAMVALNSSVNTLYFTGGYGADGDGTKEYGKLSTTVGWKFSSVNVLDSSGTLKPTPENFDVRLTVAGPSINLVRFPNGGSEAVVTSIDSYDLNVQSGINGNLRVGTANASTQATTVTIAGATGNFLVDDTPVPGSPIEILGGEGHNSGANPTDGGNVVIRPGGGGSNVIYNQVSNISQANPGVVTFSAPHSLKLYTLYNLVLDNINGMTQINGVGLSALAIDATSVQLLNQGPGNSAFDTTGFSAFSLSPSATAAFYSLSGALRLMMPSYDYGVTSGIFIDGVRWPRPGSAFDVGLTLGVRSTSPVNELTWQPPKVVPLSTSITLPTGTFDVRRSVYHGTVMRFMDAGTCELFMGTNTLQGSGIEWYDYRYHGFTGTLPGGGSFADFPVGGSFKVINWGAGTITFTAAFTIFPVINKPAGTILTMSGGGKTCTVHRVSVTEWDITGDLD